MNTITLACTECGTFESTYLPTPVPGLVLTPPHYHGKNVSAITHLRSGLAVISHESAEVLARILLEDLSSVDWTQSGTELRRDAAARDAYDRVRHHEMSPVRSRSRQAPDLNPVGVA